MVRKVSFIVNYNLYESKRHFTRKLAEALNRKGIETQIIDVQEGAFSAEAIASVRRYNPDFTASFNSLLPVNETQFLWDLLEVPHFAILVDPVLYSIHLTRSPYSILSCVDRNDFSEVRTYQFENVFFWPHAVERELKAPVQERPYDVVFMGSCYDYESLRASWRQRNPEALNKVLDDAIDLVFGDTKTSLTQALIRAWNASKMDPAGVDFTSLFYYLDNYTRGKDRVELIRSIKKARVHVFGDLSQDNAVGILGWPQYLAAQPNVSVHPSVPYGEALNIMQQSKICLNSMPFFKDGSHERVLVGLACGSLPVTTENLYFQEQFREEEDLFFYSMRDRSSVDAKVEEMLANEGKRAAMARSGREKVMAHHTWDNRVDQLLNELPKILARIEGHRISPNSEPKD